MTEAVAETIFKGLECAGVYVVVEAIKKPWAPIRKHFDFVAVEIARKMTAHCISFSWNKYRGDRKKSS